MRQSGSEALRTMLPSIPRMTACQRETEAVPLKLKQTARTSVWGKQAVAPCSIYARGEYHDLIRNGIKFREMSLAGAKSQFDGTEKYFSKKHAHFSCGGLYSPATSRPRSNLPLQFGSELHERGVDQWVATRWSLRCIRKAPFP